MRVWLAAGLLLALVPTEGCELIAAAVGIGIDESSPSSESPQTRVAPVGSQPTFGSTVSQASSPPPISGGTLLLLKDGRTAVAADPDRDMIFVADLRNKKVNQIALGQGDEPGRSVEDANGLVHVCLRRGGAIVDLDVLHGQIVSRRPVCPAPRGIAYDAKKDLVHVVCAGGELVSLPAAGGDPVQRVMLERDLRDVLVSGDQLLVSRFRSAELLTIDGTGEIVDRVLPTSTDTEGPDAAPAFTSSMAWRTIALPSGQAAMVHQLGNSGAIETGTPGSYGGPDPCSGVVRSRVSLITPGASWIAGTTINQAVLPVDVAISADQQSLFVVAAGNSHMSDRATVIQVALTDTTEDNCVGSPLSATTGQPIAVACQASGAVVIQSREPAQIQVIDPNNPEFAQLTISLSNDSREDTGHAIFHSDSGAGLACASCHAEGGEDGRVWSFSTGGASDLRRTQSLRGGIIGTEPFHWSGDEKNLSAVMDDVFVKRMSGPKVSPDQLQALSTWVNAIPLLPSSPASDGDAVARGDTLFHNAKVGCAGCHSGGHLTDNLTVDIGTGGAFQVPSLLGVGFRAPFLHDGCAPTLTDRFGTCGGKNHGQTSHLTSSDISDLVAYLETL